MTSPPIAVRHRRAACPAPGPAHFSPCPGRSPAPRRSGPPAAPGRTAAPRPRARVRTARERVVVVLRFYLELPEAQISEELGIARGTVKSALARALGKLRADAELRSGATS